MQLMNGLEHPLVSLIEQLQYLRTVNILPVVGNLLEIHIAGGQVLNDPHTVGEINDVRSIEVPEKSDIYSFYFNKFVTYNVTDEMFIRRTAGEVFEGGRIRTYSKSHFLEFTSSVTWATTDFPGPLLHYQLNTLDHTIDVVTAEPPAITVHQD